MRPTPRLAARPGMTSRATRRFWKLYESLPEPVQTAILIMEEKGTPGEGTRPTRGRFWGGCRPGALTRRGVTVP